MNGALARGPRRRTFMTRSGRNTAIPEIPIPAFDVPNAAPIAVTAASQSQMPNNKNASSKAREFNDILLKIIYRRKRQCSFVVRQVGDGAEELTAEATPAKPKKCAHGGQYMFELEASTSILGASDKVCLARQQVLGAESSFSCIFLSPLSLFQRQITTFRRAPDGLLLRLSRL